MKALIMWGAGGHAAVVLDIAVAMGCFDPVALVDDGEPDCSSLPAPLLGSSRVLLDKSEEMDCEFVVSIGDNQARARCFQAGLSAGRLPATLVHPSAIVSPLAVIGRGTVVMARAVINARAVIGQNCIVNTGAVVEHDCLIADHVHIGPGALLGGGVKIQPYVSMGLGAIALPKAVIGHSAVIGAGGVVLDAVPASATAVGVPARIVARVPVYSAE
jgi:sugar O-acyltransferase (sialic acid O-acetyltransferase NeuD family)